MKKLIFALIILCVLGTVYYRLSMKKGVKKTLVISGILQGNILPFKEKYGKLKGKYVGGMAYLSGYYKGLKPGNRYLFLDCGDNFSGTPEAYYTHGEAVITGLNALGLQAMSIGNREFDFGASMLRKNISKSNFTYLATNLKDISTDKMEFEYVKIIDLDDFKIGVIGIVPPGTAEMTEADNTVDFEFSSIRESVAGYISFLKSKGVDIIIGLTQLDIDVDSDSITYLASSGIDILQVLEYTSKKKKFNKMGRCFVVAHDGYSKGSNVQLLDFSFKNGKLECGNYRRKYIEKSGIIPDLELSSKLNEYVRKIDQIMNRVIGKIDADYKNEYYQESVIGNYICDAIREASGAEIALQNSGGIRSDLKKGKFTIRMLHDILPFDNEVILVRIKGRKLRKVFETVSLLKYGVLQVSGASYVIDTKQTPALQKVFAGGKELDLEKEYLVVTNSFLTGGGDGYTMLKEAEKVKVLGSLREMIMKHIEAQGVFSGKIESRIKVLNR